MQYTMPKQTVDRQEILDIALQMTREDGFESVNARSVARRMGYSVQLVSYLANATLAFAILSNILSPSTREYMNLL